MSVFNTESVGTVTTNFAGGKAYKVNPKFELVSILLTSMLKDGFYRTANDTLARLKELMKECDPETKLWKMVILRAIADYLEVKNIGLMTIKEKNSAKTFLKSKLFHQLCSFLNFEPSNMIDESSMRFLFDELTFLGKI